MNDRQPLYVLLAGAFGGFVSYFYSMTLGTKLPFPSLAVGLLACAVLGAAAGMIGVYLIANSDRRDTMRCLAFALICGISWKLVIEAGQGMITRHDAEKRADVYAQQAEATVHAVAKNPEKATELAAATSGLLDASKESADPDRKAQAEEQSVKAIDALNQASPQASKESTDAVAQIAVAALQSDSPEVAQKAVASLKSQPLTEDRIQALTAIANAAHRSRRSDIARAAMVPPQPQTQSQQ